MENVTEVEYFITKMDKFSQTINMMFIAGLIILAVIYAWYVCTVVREQWTTEKLASKKNFCLRKLAAIVGCIVVECELVGHVFVMTVFLNDLEAHYSGWLADADAGFLQEVTSFMDKLDFVWWVIVGVAVCVLVALLKNIRTFEKGAKEYKALKAGGRLGQSISNVIQHVIPEYDEEDDDVEAGV